MPPLRPPEHSAGVRLPPRRATVAAETDVLVIGGGPAGLAAALGAAGAGAGVVLAERYGFLGGNATAALVMPLMSFHNEAHAAVNAGTEDTLRLLPTDHGQGEAVVAGPLVELLDRLIATAGAIAPSRQTGYTVPFDPESFKLIALDLLDEAGVSYLFHALASGLVDERTVIFETKSGPLVIRAETIVDATGDGDVAAAAGAPFELGRDEDGLTQPMTLMFRIVGFDRARFGDYVRQHPGQWRGVYGLWDLIAEARATGELDLPREDLLFFATPHEGELSVNSTRISPGPATDVFALTAAEAATRRQLREIAGFLRRRVPGFEESYVVQSGMTVGVRETRRVLGDYILTADDVLGGRSFEDAVARGSYPVDIHDPHGKGTIVRPLPLGGAYDIPLRALTPRGLERLLVSGRCISGTHEAHSSYRVTPIAMATGHAAGICAALAAARRCTTRDVDHRDVQRELLRQHASLRPELATALTSR
jgi:glycine/D-amino acid oxidase-like deaminating enzyme